jgi:hypothetical protein
MRNLAGDGAAVRIQRERARGSRVYRQRFSLWRDENRAGDGAAAQIQRERASGTGKGSVSGEMRNRAGDGKAARIQREQARGSRVYRQRFSLWRDEKLGRRWGSRDFDESGREVADSRG